MTLASDLAHIICTGIIPEPGMIHDPTQPLVLGNQTTNDYVVITWDAIAHRCSIQSVYQPPGGSLRQSVLTFDSLGTLLINGASLATAVPEIANAVTAAQTAAASATASASNAQVSETNASSASSQAANAANTAVQQADLSAQYASAPSGTSLPGGGDSAAVNAQKAADVAVESRDLDVSDPVTTNETFSSGFLFTERQVTVSSPTQITVTIPPGIFSSGEKKSRWAAYRLRGTGSVKFQGQAGGTNLVTPTVKARGRFMKRVINGNSTVTRDYATSMTMPAITDGDLLIIVQATHSGTGSILSLNLTTPGTTGLTWNTLTAYPANARGTGAPDYYIARARLVGAPARTINININEGQQTYYHQYDWWALDGTTGAAPIVGVDMRALQNRSSSLVNLLAVPAQAKVLSTAMQNVASVNSQFSAMDAKLSLVLSGNTNGIDESGAGMSDTDNTKNAVWAIGDGTINTTGDISITTTWTQSVARVGGAAVAYHPKSVIGGGTVVLNCEGGPSRDTLNIQNGVAELWFQNDGVTVDLRTPWRT